MVNQETLGQFYKSIERQTKYKSVNTLVYLILLEHVGFAKGLHGIDLSRVQLLNQTDLAKGTLSNDLDGHKVVQAQTCPSEPQELGLLATQSRQLSMLALLTSWLCFQLAFKFYPPK